MAAEVLRPEVEIEFPRHNNDDNDDDDDDFSNNNVNENHYGNVPTPRAGNMATATRAQPQSQPSPPRIHRHLPLQIQTQQQQQLQQQQQQQYQQQQQQQQQQYEHEESEKDHPSTSTSNGMFNMGIGRPSSPTSPTATSPKTRGDDGQPTSSASEDLQRSLDLIRDERHLVAYELYRDARNRVHLWGGLYNNQRTTTTTTTATPTATMTPTRRFFGSSAVNGTKATTATTAADQRQKEGQKDWEKAKQILLDKAEEFDRLEQRAHLFERAKQNLTVDDDWILSQTLFGITTYYRREHDGSLAIKLEGEMIGIPLFEQVAVVRETDLYHLWAPFCTGSRKLAQLGKIDTVAWFMTGLPQFGLSRDACFRAIGCDCMREDGSIMIVGEGLGDKKQQPQSKGDATTPTFKTNHNTEQQKEEEEQQHRRMREQQQYKRDYVSESSISNLSSNLDNDNDEEELNAIFTSYLSRDSILETIQIPPPPTKFGSGRITIHSFQASIDVLSPSSARTRVVCNINPNMKYIPQGLIDFCMKKMCGVLLNRLQTAARKIVKDPIKSPHARRMREDSHFYERWLLPKFESYCYELGWELPPVAAFQVKEEDMDEDEWILHNEMKRSRDNGTNHSSNNNDNEDDEDGWTRRSSLSEIPTTTTKKKVGTYYSDLSTSSVPTEGMKQPFSSSSSVKSSASSSRISKLVSMRRKQKSADNQRRRIAAARRAAALRLKPAPFSEEETERLQILKHAQQRVASRDRRQQQQEQQEQDQDQDQQQQEGDGNVRTRSIGESILPSSSSSLEWVARGWKVFLRLATGTHNTISPQETLPWLLLLLVTVFSNNYGPLYTYVTQSSSSASLSSKDQNDTFSELLPPSSSSTTTISTTISNIIMSLTIRPLLTILSFLWKDILSIILMILYAFLFWSVVNTSLAIAFDSIELPGKGITKKALDDTKKFYAKLGRQYTGYGCLIIILISTIKAIWSSIWTGVILHTILMVWNTMIHMISSTTNGLWIEQQHYTPSFLLYMIHYLAQLWIKFQTLMINILSILIGFIMEFPFIPTMVWLISQISKFLWILCSSIYQIWCKPMNPNSTWRKDALDGTKIVMSYCIIFLFIALFLGSFLLPDQQQQQNQQHLPTSALKKKKKNGETTTKKKKTTEKSINEKEEEEEEDDSMAMLSACSNENDNYDDDDDTSSSQSNDSMPALHHHHYHRDLVMLGLKEEQINEEEEEGEEEDDGPDSFIPSTTTKTTTTTRSVSSTTMTTNVSTKKTKKKTTRKKLGLKMVKRMLRLEKK